MSLFATLDIGARALRVFQQAIQTTSHNISNVNTEGYSRQRASLGTMAADVTSDNIAVGRGVEINDIYRLRDQFIDDQVRGEVANKGYTDSLVTTYQILESTFNEPSDTGLNERLTQFWNSWQEITSNPTSSSLRSNLRAQTVALTEEFGRLNNQLNQQITDLNTGLTTEVNQLNNQLTRLDEINNQIRSNFFKGITPNDQFDERDKLVTDISETFNVRAVIQTDGSVKLSVSGVYLLDETGPHYLEARPVLGDPQGHVDIIFEDFQEPVDIQTGTLKGLIQSRDTIIPEFQDKLNELAAGLIEKVNDLHEQGMGLDGAIKVIGSLPMTGTLSADARASINGVNINFFSGDNLISIVGRINAEEANTGVHASIESNRLSLTPSTTVTPQTVHITEDPTGLMETLGIIGPYFQGTDASDIAISDMVEASLDRIASSSNGAPGNNDISRAIAQLKDSLTMSDDTLSFNDFYHVLVAEMGSEAEAAKTAQTNQELLLNQLEGIRESVSGVSLDEEMVNLMKFQKSYEMAAKLIQVTDEMLDTLINTLRR